MAGISIWLVLINSHWYVDIMPGMGNVLLFIFVYVLDTTMIVVSLGFFMVKNVKE